jgi:hypothetical protein
LGVGAELNLPTLGFSLLIAVVATVLSGTAPALLVARADLNESLKEGGRSGGAGSGPIVCAACWWSAKCLW